MAQKGNLKLRKKGKTEFEALQSIMTDEMPYDELDPYYEVVMSGKGSRGQDLGVWYHDVGVFKDDDGKERPFYKKPLFLSDPFLIVGRGIDADDNGYRIVKYKRNGQEKTVAFPTNLIGRNDGWGFLRNLDIGVYQHGTRLGHLTNYLQWHGDKTQYTISKRGGWTSRESTAFMMQTGDTIGKPSNPIIYIGDKSRRAAFVERGSLKDWQDNVCRYLAGNSRPLLALGAVLAAPLLSIAHMESGGFHFYGSSSIGKSVSGIVALSAMGDPFQLKIQWNGTSLSFENEAAANNDGCLFLDEIHQADVKVVKDIAYSLFNGVSKGQGKKDGGNRARERWLVTAISTGEFDVARYMEAAGIDWTAGQAVRMPSIPADIGTGNVFEVLHGFNNSKELVDHLYRYSNENCGVAFPLFVQKIAACMAENPVAFKAHLGSLKNAFIEQLPPEMGTQAARVSERLALAAAALELASEWGITGFAAGVGSAGVLKCFKAWHELNGGLNREELQIIQAARELLARDGRGERFTDLTRAEMSIGVGLGYVETNRNHAGFRIVSKDGEYNFYMTDEVFKEEICKGKDEVFTAKVLCHAGWLRTDNGRLKARLTHRLLGRKTLRLYCLVGFAPPSEAEYAD